MNITLVIPEEQNITPVIFMIIHHGLCVFLKTPSSGSGYKKK